MVYACSDSYLARKPAEHDAMRCLAIHSLPSLTIQQASLPCMSKYQLVPDLPQFTNQPRCPKDSSRLACLPHSCLALSRFSHLSLIIQSISRPSRRRHVVLFHAGRVQDRARVTIVRLGQKGLELVGCSTGYDLDSGFHHRRRKALCRGGSLSLSLSVGSGVWGLPG